MPKSRVASHFSLRCKFKDERTVEIVVMNLDNNDIYQLCWTFDSLDAKPQVSKSINSELKEDEE